jgi:hypothetical protein
MSLKSILDTPDFNRPYKFPTLEQFLAGDPIRYIGFKGKRLTAVYYATRLPCLQVFDRDTTDWLFSTMMKEPKAIKFYESIPKPPELKIVT